MPNEYVSRECEYAQTTRGIGPQVEPSQGSQLTDARMNTASRCHILCDRHMEKEKDTHVANRMPFTLSTNYRHDTT